MKRLSFDDNCFNNIHLLSAVNFCDSTGRQILRSQSVKLSCELQAIMGREGVAK